MLEFDEEPRSFGMVFARNTGDALTDVTVDVQGGGQSRITSPAFIGRGENKLLAVLDGTGPATVTVTIAGHAYASCDYPETTTPRRRRNPRRDRPRRYGSPW